MSGGAGLINGIGFDPSLTLTLTNAGTGLIVNNTAVIKTLQFPNGSTQITATISGNGAPSGAPSQIGQTYLDLIGKREYRAYGTSSSADWLKVPVYASGVGTITAGADLTVTLPWDWSGGILKVVNADTPTNWGDFAERESSYDSLTNAGYTNGQTYYSTSPGGSGFVGFAIKTTNQRGIPKAATSTSFTLDSDGTATYIKWFVWA